MKSYLTLIAMCLALLLFTAASTSDNDFKFQQLTYDNVKTAYLDKENKLKKLVISKGISSFSNHIYIRAFKYEQIAELWVKPPSIKQYVLLKKYKICEKSGSFGPKLLKGDQQIPEGFYEINDFDHDNKDFLALGINYPNAADQARGSAKDDVVLRGGCSSEGNIPLEEDAIKELYVMAVEAKAAGQESIPVHIFPAYMTDVNVGKLQNLFPGKPDYYALWSSLQKGFVYFNKTRRLPGAEITNMASPPLAGDGGSSTTIPAASLAAAAPAKPNGENVAVASNVGYRGVAKDEEAAQEQYSATAATAIAANTQVIATSAVEQKHHVATGQTLYSISKQYGITLDQIKEWNNIRSNNIKIGQELQVSRPTSYKVKRGDTMYSIAKKNDVTVEDIVSWNNLDGYVVVVGTTIRIAP
ncbi:LysM peptidoglycan-binding domain-containing protein [Flammeovirgaceae bacterium SG7u.111]|nr:LysM peptidoglycan-binding domain-containing protein [Flammeovirgaceae bacterium SG7u.132]WPO35645.1 LysM peptidoglycan-binding domain-containing protein [Flammeovirgaceae bacterium SG7u.111]